MRQLIIYRRFFTNADCYTRGTKQTSVGVQVHSTGANNPYLKRYVQPDDGRLGKNTNGNSHNRKGLNVCASAYIGKLADGTVAVYQTLPWNYRCWPCRLPPFHRLHRLESGGRAGLRAVSVRREHARAAAKAERGGRDPDRVRLHGHRRAGQCGHFLRSAHGGSRRPGAEHGGRSNAAAGRYAASAREHTVEDRKSVV